MQTDIDLIFTRAKRAFNESLAAGTLMKSYTTIFAQILRLRQACCHPVLVRNKEIVADEEEAALAAASDAAGFADDMALAGHEIAACWQLGAVDEGCIGILGREDVAEPVLHQRAQSGIVELQQVDERFEAGRRVGSCRRRNFVDRKQRQLGRRRVIEKSLGPIQVGNLDRKSVV